MVPAIAVKPKVMTEEEQKERFMERQRNRRLEDFANDNFDELIEIDDPFAIFANAKKPDSSDDDNDEDEDEAQPKSIKNRFSQILGKRHRNR